MHSSSVPSRLASHKRNPVACSEVVLEREPEQWE